VAEAGETGETTRQRQNSTEQGQRAPGRRARAQKAQAQRAHEQAQEQLRGERKGGQSPEQIVGGGGEGMAPLWRDCFGAARPERKKEVEGPRGPRKRKKWWEGTQRCASDRIRKEREKKKTKERKRRRVYIVENVESNGRIATVTRLAMAIPRELELPARRNMNLAEPPHVVTSSAEALQSSNP
jgi:hypothetical protein